LAGGGGDQFADDQFVVERGLLLRAPDVEPAAGALARRGGGGGLVLDVGIWMQAAAKGA
jgi:hypothetical protein